MSQRLAREYVYRTDAVQFRRYRKALERRLSYLAGSEAAAELAPFLTASLSDDDSDVRGSAAASLVQLGQASPEVLNALVHALSDENVNVRGSAAASLGQLGQASPEVLNALVHALQEADSWPVRRDAARSLGQSGAAEDELIAALWRGLLDSDNDVRAACAEALAMLGRRFPASAGAIAKKLVQAIQDPEFDQPDRYRGRTGHDYAFDGLWLLMAGGGLDH